MPDSLSASARLLVALNRRFPRHQRPVYFETEAYGRWLATMGSELYKCFYSKHATFSGKRILDLGCGYGGKTRAYARYAPSFVCGLDLQEEVLGEAKRALAESSTPFGFARADAARLPFAEGSFDIVISDDGFDHFQDPAGVLREMLRVLKPGGVAFVTFVPYKWTDCSHLTEFLRVPWHHIVFSERVLLEAMLYLERQEGVENRSPARGVFNTFKTQLSRLTVSGFRRELTRLHGARLVALRAHSSAPLRTATYVPILREYATDTVMCAIERRETERIGHLDLAHHTWRNVLTDGQLLLERFRKIVMRRGRTEHPPR